MLRRRHLHFTVWVRQRPGSLPVLVGTALIYQVAKLRRSGTQLRPPSPRDGGSLIYAACVVASSRTGSSSAGRCRDEWTFGRRPCAASMSLNSVSTYSEIDTPLSAAASLTARRIRGSTRAWSRTVAAFSSRRCALTLLIVPEVPECIRIWRGVSSANMWAIIPLDGYILTARWRLVPHTRPPQPHDDPRQFGR